MVFFFVFQAEDGIRDIGVTGVQTCALPICRLARQPPALDLPAGDQGELRPSEGLPLPPHGDGARGGAVGEAWGILAIQSTTKGRPAIWRTGPGIDSKVLGSDADDVLGRRALLALD